MNFKLGVKAKDRITGFEGIVTGECVYISGCDQVCLQPPVDKEGKIPEGKWFDVQRVEVMPDAAITLDNAKTPGFDTPAPVR